MLDKRLKARLIKDIQECIWSTETGEPDTSLIHLKYSQVPKSTRYRFIRSCLNNPPKEVIEQTKLDVQKQVKKRNPRLLPKTGLKKVKDELGFMPTAATISVIGIEKFNFQWEIHKLLNDSDLVRSKAIKANEDGSEKVINPKLLLQTIAIKKGLLDSQLNLQKALLDMDRTISIMTMILDTVADLAPEVFAIILGKLETLEAQLGAKYY